MMASGQPIKEQEKENLLMTMGISMKDYGKMIKILSMNDFKNNEQDDDDSDLAQPINSSKKKQEIFDSLLQLLSDEPFYNDTVKYY